MGINVLTGYVQAAVKATLTVVAGIPLHSWDEATPVVSERRSGRRGQRDVLCCLIEKGNEKGSVERALGIVAGHLTQAAMFAWGPSAIRIVFRLPLALLSQALPPLHPSS